MNKWMSWSPVFLFLTSTNICPRVCFFFFPCQTHTNKLGILLMLLCVQLSLLPISYLFIIVPPPPNILHVLFGWYVKVSFELCCRSCWSVLLCRDRGSLSEWRWQLYTGRSVFGQSQPKAFRERIQIVLSADCYRELLLLLCGFFCCRAQTPITNNIRKKDTFWIAVWWYSSSWAGRHSSLGAVANVAEVAGTLFTWFWTRNMDNGQVEARPATFRDSFLLACSPLKTPPPPSQTKLTGEQALKHKSLWGGVPSKPGFNTQVRVTPERSYIITRSQVLWNTQSCETRQSEIAILSEDLFRDVGVARLRPPSNQTW